MEFPAKAEFSLFWDSPLKAVCRICLTDIFFQERQTIKALHLLNFVLPSENNGGLEY